MSPEPNPPARPESAAASGAFSCLHVVAQQRGWLLPVRSISAIINRPTLQAIPTVTMLDHLVVQGSKVFSAMSLGRAWHPESASFPEGPADWGLLVGPPETQIVLLVEDLVGSREIDDRDVEWLEDGADEPLLGVVPQDDELLLLVDPRRSTVFQSDRDAEDEYPWIDLRKLAPDLGEGRTEAGHDQLMVVLEDLGLGFALPAQSVFNVQRAAGTALDAQASRLSAAIGRAPQSSSQEPGPSVFCCRVGSHSAALPVTFDRLVAWQILDKSRLRPWAAMEQFSAQGAFTLPGTRQVVLVVDPERLLARNRDRLSAVERAQLTHLGARPQPMSTNPTEQIVRMRVRGSEVAVRMSEVQFIASLRRSHIHPVTAPDPAVVGVLERTDAFSTIVDLGQLLFQEPVPRRASARLVTVESDASVMTLLAESVLEPHAVGPGDRQRWPGGGQGGLPDRFVTDGIRVGEGEVVPLLDLAEILAEVTRTSADG